MTIAKVVIIIKTDDPKADDVGIGKIIDEFELIDFETIIKTKLSDALEGSDNIPSYEVIVDED